MMMSDVVRGDAYGGKLRYLIYQSAAIFLEDERKQPLAQSIV